MAEFKLTTIQSPNSEFITVMLRFEAVSDSDYDPIGEMEMAAAGVVFESKVSHE